MTDKSRPAHLVGLQPDLTTAGLSAQQRTLVVLMREHRFGHIENMQVKDGQPVLDRAVRVVRVARLSEASRGALDHSDDEFELKRPARNLLDELARLGNGTVIRLEFRHGLPFLIEIIATIAESKAPNPLMAVEGDHHDHDG